MPVLDIKHTDSSEVDLPIHQEFEDPGINQTLVRSDIICSYRVAEFVTLAYDGPRYVGRLHPISKTCTR